MGTKDMAEQYLEAYNDVFADIANVLLFDGERIVDPEQLTNDITKSVYKADDQLHEQERDISKFWNKGNTRIAIYGIENQSSIHPHMPLRIIGYDGASYRGQLLSRTQEAKYPVITMVLYFGTDQPWLRPQKLSDCMRIPDKIKPYFSDYRINIFNIAFLPDQTTKKFTSDFRIVADYFSQVRRNKEYIPSDEEMIHMDAVLKLMSVMTGDERFTEAQRLQEGEVHTMCEVLDRVEERGIQRGIQQGMQQGIQCGIQQGQFLLADAIKRLNHGETAEQIIADGVDENTVELAVMIKKEM